MAAKKPTTAPVKKTTTAKATGKKTAKKPTTQKATVKERSIVVKKNRNGDTTIIIPA